MASSDDETRLADTLKETTLRVYVLMIRRDTPLSLREVQRQAGLSSPSLALYHLKKLQELGLVNTHPDDGYVVCKRVDIGILRFFMGRGLTFMPRSAAYCVFFLTSLLVYLLIFGYRGAPAEIVLVVSLLMGALFSAYEAYALWNTEPLGFGRP